MIHSHLKAPFSQILRLISQCENEAIIFSPYITTNMLDKLLSNCDKKITIVTTWRVKDLCMGISDIELYTYTHRKSITLYLSEKLHLKAYISDWRTYIFGSANLTYNGLAFEGNHNYELCSDVTSLDVDTELYFKQIINKSMLVDEDIYQQYKHHIETQPVPTYFKEITLTKTNKSEFLISSLPMSRSVDLLFELYSSGYVSQSYEDIDCAIHDIALFNIPPSLSKEVFTENLTLGFFKSKFVNSLVEFIGNDGRYFGEVKEWIQNNCSDVPVPSRRDLTGNIQVLYKWIVELGNGRFAVERPNYSERIHKVK